MRLDVSIAATEGDLVEIERCLETIRLLTDWIVSGGPDTTRPRIAQVDEIRTAVGRGIVAPPSDRDITPHAEAAAGVRDRRRVAPVREEVRMRGRRVRRSKATCR